MKLINKKDDKVNNKTVYTLEIEYGGKKTPDRKSIIEEASKELRLDAKNLIIKKSGIFMAEALQWWRFMPTKQLMS